MLSCYIVSSTCDIDDSIKNVDDSFFKLCLKTFVTFAFVLTLLMLPLVKFNNLYLNFCTHSRTFTEKNNFQMISNTHEVMINLVWLMKKKRQSSFWRIIWFWCCPQCHKCCLAARKNMIKFQKRRVLEDSKTVFTFSVSPLVAESF